MRFYVVYAGFKQISEDVRVLSGNTFTSAADILLFLKAQRHMKIDKDNRADFEEFAKISNVGDGFWLTQGGYWCAYVIRGA